MDNIELFVEIAVTAINRLYFYCILRFLFVYVYICAYTVGLYEPL